MRDASRSGAEWIAIRFVDDVLTPRVLGCVAPSTERSQIAQMWVRLARRTGQERTICSKRTKAALVDVGRGERESGIRPEDIRIRLEEDHFAVLTDERLDAIPWTTRYLPDALGGGIVHEDLAGRGAGVERRQAVMTWVAAQRASRVECDDVA